MKNKKQMGNSTRHPRTNEHEVGDQYGTVPEALEGAESREDIAEATREEVKDDLSGKAEEAEEYEDVGYILDQYVDLGGQTIPVTIDTPKEALETLKRVQETLAEKGLQENETESLRELLERIRKKQT